MGTGTFARALAAAVVATGLACAGCSGARPMQVVATEVALDPGPATLPVHWEAGLCLVDAWIGGRGPWRLLLDTGTSAVALSPAAADAAGLARTPIDPELGGLRVVGAQGTETRAPEGVWIDELRAGPLVLRGLDAMLLETAAFERVSGVRIDGLLPSTAFRGVLLTLDYPGRAVSVAQGALPPPDGDEVLALLPGHLPRISCDFGGEPCEVLLDTGSMEFLSLPAARQASLRFRSPPVETGRYSTVGGTVTRRQGRLAGSISWGRHRIAEPVIGLSAADAGSAGVEFLRSFRVTLDLANGRARFERGATVPVTSGSLRGLGAGLLRTAGAWTVGYVLDGSPAARAGLAEGDRIAAVEGTPVAEIGLSAFDELIRRRSSLRLHVAAPGAPRDVVVPVVTLVE